LLPRLVHPAKNRAEAIESEIANFPIVDSLNRILCIYPPLIEKFRAAMYIATINGKDSRVVPLV
jgi:hypothetical protein